MSTASSTRDEIRKGKEGKERFCKVGVSLCLFAKKSRFLNWVWLGMQLIPILRRLRLEDPEYKASLGYIARLLS